MLVSLTLIDLTDVKSRPRYEQPLGGSTIVGQGLASIIANTISDTFGHDDLSLHLNLSQVSSAFYQIYECEARWKSMCYALGYAVPASASRRLEDTWSYRAIMAAVNRRVCSSVNSS